MAAIARGVSMETDYHKRVEEIYQEVDRLRFHVNTSARTLQHDSELALQALEHLDQALENLRRSYDWAKKHVSDAVSRLIYRGSTVAVNRVPEFFRITLFYSRSPRALPANKKKSGEGGIRTHETA